MRILGEATLVYALVNVSLRLLIWVLPVFLGLRWVDAEEPVAARGTDRDSGRFLFDSLLPILLFCAVSNKTHSR